jgi:hypothetical protein
MREAGGARFDLAGERALRGRRQRLGVGTTRGRIGCEAESIEAADDMAFDHNLASLGDFRFEHRVFSHAPHQNAGAAVDEPFGQPFMQSIGKPILYGAGDALPVFGVAEPVGPVRRESPRPDMGNTVRKRVNIAVSMIGKPHLPGEPVGRYPTLPHQKTIEGDDEFGMRRR